VLLVTYGLSGRADIWIHSTRDTLAYWTGRTTRDEFNAKFAIPGLVYDYAASERIGDWIRDHSSADDEIAVRGFQPEIYEVARRRYAGRFFWTNFIVDDERSLRKDEWHTEDVGVLEKSRPRYVVAVATGGDIDRPEFFERLGYEKRLEDGVLSVLERPATAGKPGAAR
jgi:hypothetical protein